MTLPKATEVGLTVVSVSDLYKAKERHLECYSELTSSPIIAGAFHSSTFTSTLGRGAWRLGGSTTDNSMITSPDDANRNIPPNAEFLEITFNFCTSFDPVINGGGNPQWETTDYFLLEVQFSNDGGNNYQALEASNQFVYGARFQSKERCGYDPVVEAIEIPNDADKFQVAFKGRSSRIDERGLSLIFCTFTLHHTTNKTQSLFSFCRFWCLQFTFWMLQYPSVGVKSR